MIETKWTNAGLPLEWLRKDPDGAARIVKLGLHHPARIWNVVRWSESKARLEIMVHQQWKPAASFLSRVRKQWNEWVLKHRPQAKMVITADGFTSRYSAAWQKMPVCAVLEAEQYARIQAVAQSTPSPLASGEKSAVLEVITAFKPPSGSCWRSGIDEVLLGPKHPWLRLIGKDGRVYNVGFSPSTPLNCLNVLFSQKGEFRSPDTYEGMPLDRRLVTPIAISEAQFEEIKALIERYQQEGKVFNYCSHNCTAFVSDILGRVGFDVDTTMALPEVAYRCLPKVLQKILSPLQWLVMKVWKAASWIFASISCGRRTESERFALKPPGFLNFYLPYKVTLWQQQQASTKAVPQNSSFIESL